MVQGHINCHVLMDVMQSDGIIASNFWLLLFFANLVEFVECLDYMMVWAGLEGKDCVVRLQL